MSQRNRGKSHRIRSNVKGSRTPDEPPSSDPADLATPTPGPFVVSLESAPIAVAAEPPPGVPTTPEEPPFSERPTLPEPEPVDPEHEGFFDRGAAVASMPHDDPSLDAPPDAKLVLKMRPEVRARRAKLTRYVQGTVGLLVVVCVVALGKLVAAHGPERTVSTTPSPRGAGLLGETPRPPGLAMAEIENVIAEPPPAPPAVPDTTPAAPVPDPKAAADLKTDARIALERGAFARAVDAGERSVALDAQDGEAWLILGAAYQSLGKSAEARRSFVACTKDGTRGPLGECRAMLR